ncbi:MAG: hypothetical protein AAGI63_18515 [Planctomycetota bacterium]
MRYRLRTLMLVIALLASLAVVAEFATRDYRERRRIEADLFSMGANYVSLDENNAPSFVSFINPVGFDGIPKYGSFDHLDFAGASLTDDAIRYVSELDNVQVLHLTECNVSDAHLRILTDIGSI